MVRAVLDKRKHTVNGKFYGWWVRFEGDVQLYLAYRKGGGSRGYYRLKDAWCFDLSMLNEAKHRGVQFIGVVHQTGKRRDFYGTPLNDLFGGLSEVHAEGVVRQRRLGRKCFRINPMTNPISIAKAIKIR